MPHALWDDYKLTPFCGDFYPNNVNTVDSIEVSSKLEDSCMIPKLSIIEEKTHNIKFCTFVYL